MNALVGHEAKAIFALCVLDSGGTASPQAHQSLGDEVSDLKPPGFRRHVTGRNLVAFNHGEQTSERDSVRYEIVGGGPSFNYPEMHHPAPLLRDDEERHAKIRMQLH
ncbi:MAG: hypothetical protein ACRETW_04110 [Stenotrophobium sp.]